MKLKNIKFDGIILATFLTNVFYSSTYPYINKAFMQVLPTDIVAANQIVICLSIIIFGRVWNKLSDKLYNHFVLLCVTECVVNLSTTILFLCKQDIVTYYILDTLSYSIVTRNIIFGGNKLTILRYTEEKEREHFSNNNSAAASAATIIGSFIAMILDLDLNLMLILATIGNMIDNMFYITIYTKMRSEKPMSHRDKSYIDKNIQKRKVRLINGKYTIVNTDQIVGFCYSPVHRGYITKKLLKEHDCIKKNCNKLERMEDYPFWKNYIKKKEQRDSAKAKKKVKSELNDLMLQSAIELSQNTDIHIHYISADLSGRNKYTIFYTSGCSYDDSNRYSCIAKQMNKLYSRHFRMKHIKNQYGEYVKS